MIRSVFILDADQAKVRMAAAWRAAQSYLELGKRVRVTVEEYRARRSREQNDLFHAFCRDVAEARPTWAGHPMDPEGEGWKRLFVDAWARTEGRPQCRIVPSLDGLSVVNLGIQTRSLSPIDMSDLITCSQAWAADEGIPLHDHKGASNAADE